MKNTLQNLFPQSLKPGRAAIAGILGTVAYKYHPMIKSGELPKLATWLSFFQNIVRHFVFGITLGLLYRD
jgi:hypothetical protein